MAVEWIIPAAKEAYKHRAIAFSTWDKVIEKIFGPKSRIALVGPGGIGKTVLLDHLTGIAKKPNYSPPGRSHRAEFGKAKSSSRRLALVVAPGQGGPQIDTFNHVFNPKHAVDGVIFVVGYGFVTLREPEAIQASIKRGYDTVESWWSLNQQSELDYLRDVAGQIRSVKAQSRNPKWLLVAVTKSDLFYDGIQHVKAYYSPHGGSEFSTVLDDLQGHVGSDNMAWDAVPICSQLDDFVWGTEVVKSKLSADERDHYLAQFVKRIGELCR